MAGHRHHILPRFLLKGFASKVDGNESFVWVFRKSAKPYEANIINTSVENYFYGRYGEINADDEITKVERPFAYLIDSLRDITRDVESCDPKIAEFIAHIAIRSKNLRSGGLNLVEEFSKRFLDHLSKPSNIQKLVRMFERHFTGSMSMKMPQLTDKERMAIADKLVGEILEKVKNDKEKIAQIYTDIHKESKEFIENNATKKIKDGHNELLKKNPIPNEKLEGYKQLNWFVCNIGEDLIFGDAGSLIETAGKIKFKTFEYADDYIANIFLPISTRKIIVGTRYAKPQKINAKLLNRASASSAVEYFVSSKKTEKETALFSKIGQWAGIIPDSEIEWTIQNMFQELFKDVRG